MFPTIFSTPKSHCLHYDSLLLAQSPNLSPSFFQSVCTVGTPPIFLKPKFHGCLLKNTQWLPSPVISHPGLPPLDSKSSVSWCQAPPAFSSLLSIPHPSDEASFYKVNVLITLGSSVGILTLFFISLWGLLYACMLSRVQLFVTPWTAVHQAPLSMGFSRQEY